MRSIEDLVTKIINDECCGVESAILQSGMAEVKK